VYATVLKAFTAPVHGYPIVFQCISVEVTVSYL